MMREATQIDPQSTQSQSNLAIMLKDAGAPAHECIQAAQRALELQPSNGELYHNLAHMMQVCVSDLKRACPVLCAERFASVSCPCVRGIARGRHGGCCGLLAARVGAES